MTSERERSIFLHYAFPCAAEKLNAGKISQEMYEELEKAAMNNISPSSDLLKRCFPKRFAQFEADLNLMSAEESWRRHQGSGGDCATKTTTVCAVDALGAMVIYGSETFVAINLYSLPITVGNTVTVHRRVIIEVL